MQVLSRICPLLVLMVSGVSILAVSIPAVANDQNSNTEHKQQLWQSIEPYFTPTPEFADDFGTYTSPLVNADGEKITTPAAWATQRAALLQNWHDRLKHWPELLDQPDLKRLETTDYPNHTEYKVEVQVSSEGYVSQGYLLIPKNLKGPVPAVFIPFYEPETSVSRGVRGQGTHDYGLQLTERGFVTLSIGTPAPIGSDDTDTRNLLIAAGEAQKRQPLTFLASVAANCHTALANLPEVDENRIGIIGFSYGGKWTMFASCLYDKFACAVWSDPGVVFDESNRSVNYYEAWYLGYEPGVSRPRGVPSAERPRTGLYREMIENGEDLVPFITLIAPRPVLISGGTEDPPKNWRAVNHIRAVSELLGYPNRVAMSFRDQHRPTPEASAIELNFLEYWLRYGLDDQAG